MSIKEKLALQKEINERNDRRWNPAPQWSYADAVALAIDELSFHEIMLGQVDKRANELWREMEKENEALLTMA